MNCKHLWKGFRGIAWCDKYGFHVNPQSHCFLCQKQNKAKDKQRDESIEALAMSFMELSTSVIGIAMMLIEKGVTTDEELAEYAERARRYLNS